MTVALYSCGGLRRLRCPENYSGVADSEGNHSRRPQPPPAEVSLQLVTMSVTDKGI